MTENNQALPFLLLIRALFSSVSSLAGLALAFLLLEAWTVISCK